MTARTMTDPEMRTHRRRGRSRGWPSTAATADTSDELQEAAAVAADAPALADRTTTFAVRLPSAGLERTREIAEAEGLTTSALVRRWVDARIDAHR